MGMAAGVLGYLELDNGDIRERILISPPPVFPRGFTASGLVTVVCAQHDPSAGASTERKRRLIARLFPEEAQYVALKEFLPADNVILLKESKKSKQKYLAAQVPSTALPFREMWFLPGETADISSSVIEQMVKESKAFYCKGRETANTTNQNQVVGGSGGSSSSNASAAVGVPRT
jgi:hypothetical protein